MELKMYGMNKQGQLKSITKKNWVFHLSPLTISSTIYTLWQFQVLVSGPVVLCSMSTLGL